jgi:hypothetical protein
MTNEEAIDALKSIGVDEALEDGRALLLVNNVDSCTDAIRLAIAALERDRWISVEERLPERNTEVLVYAIGDADGFWGKHVIAIAERFIFRIFPSSEGEEEWSSPWQYFHTDYKITHWRSLPEPPKEET